MLTQNTYIDKRTIEGLTVGTYIITLFFSENNGSTFNSLFFSDMIPKSIISLDQFVCHVRVQTPDIL